jgi:TetR/AcrR family transcriptional regulator, regulator of cefoperazone and chloramphenicol sensitivity
MMTRMGTAAESVQTRAQLIDAAGQLFAERGFAGVSVRDIVAAAKTHLSAINYHFRDKAGLYRACVESALATPKLDAIQLSDLQTGEPRKMLRKVVAALVGDSAVAPADSWKSRLYLRLLDDHSGEFDWLEKVARPRYQILRAVVAGNAPEYADAVRIDLATMTLISLLEDLSQDHRILNRLAPALSKHVASPAQLIDLLIDTTLAILRGTGRSSARSSK